MTNPDRPTSEQPFDDETLAAFVDGSLEADARADVERRLAEDPMLRATVADLVHARDAALDAAPAPAGLADRILADLPASSAPAADGGAFMPRTTDSFRFLPLAAAAALLIGLSLMATLGGDPAVEPETQAGDAPPLIAERGDPLPEAPVFALANIELPKTPAGYTAGERYLAHLSVDKPTYRPGERVFGRALVLEAFRHVPATGQGVAYFELKSPKGDTVHKQHSKLVEGAAAFGYEIPKGIGGGTFKLLAHVNDLPPVETTLDIRDFRAPRIKTDLQFERKAYGPGDRVVATLEAERAEGGIPAGAGVTAVARVDGTEVFRKALELDGIGRCSVGFELPAEIAEGEGTLALVIADGGVRETAAKTIPIVVARVAVRFFPEGGDLIAGVPCGVYFDAKTPRQEPADIKGRILDDQGAEVATFETLHEGRGRVALTPRAGRVYTAVIDAPSGVDKVYTLPGVQEDGVSLTARADAFRVGEPIRVAVAAAKETTATVGVYVRERNLAIQTVTIPAGKPVEVKLPVEDDLAGVFRVTVFDEKAAPVAERLVFRQPARAANVELVSSADRTIPGAPVEVRVKTTDENGRPVRALVGLSATDDAVLTQPEPRKRAARLPAQALLGCQVEELKDPGAYLTGDAEGFRNIDLLLGTQGWRRFAFADEPQAVTAKLGDDARRALAWNDQLAPEVLSSILSFRFSETATPFVVNGQLRGIDKVAPLFEGRWGADQAWRAFDVLRAAGAPAPVAGGGGPGRPPEPPKQPQGEPQAMGAPALGGEGIAGGGDGGVAAEGGVADLPPPAGVPPGMRAPDDPVPPPAPQGPAVDGDPRPDPALLAELEEVLGDMKLAEKALANPMMNKRVLRIVKDAEELGPDLDARIKHVGRLLLLIDQYGGQTAPAGPAWARMFAHQTPENRPAADRTDFTETVYWNAGTWTDANGELKVSFDLSDSITTVRVRADAVTATGGLGEADAMIEVRRPLYVEPKFPLEVTAGDRVELPLAIANGTAASVEATLEIVSSTGFTVDPAALTPLSIAADTSARLVLPMTVDAFQGTGEIAVRVTAGEHTDLVRRTMRVVPAGFPIQANVGGVLERKVVHTFTIPEDVDPSSVRTEGAVYPTPLASLQDALKGLLREPHGCFEQTSSTNYPNVMVLQYLSSHEGADPALVKHATALLEKGYARLVSYECKQKGYEWFGGDPGHEALTAYGILQFRDMAQVMNVDAAMLERTRAWLLARRDGRGGFKRNSRALDSFGRAPQEITDAYILWSLIESGEQGLDTEIALLKSRAKDSKDSYLLALAANVAWLSDDRDFAKTLMNRLADAQAKTGVVEGATTSITRSGGSALQIETTALSILAWMRSPDHTRHVELAMKWLAERCKGGRFGSTQSTVLALKAIVTYDAARATARKDGIVRIVLDGEQLYQRPFKADQQGPIELPDLSSHFTPGEHTLELVMEGGVDMPYAFTLAYNAMTPASAKDAAVDIETRISTDRIVEGEPLDVPVTVRNTTDAGLPMVTAVVGLPGGVEVRAEQLKELVKQGLVDFVELRGRDVVLYWRSMAPGAEQTLSLSAIAAVPGTYEAAASRTYLYYTDEAKVWTEGLRITVEPK
ncbi:MAG: alpha-2-macroglobulin family protein [Planctomycetota bacterium]|nr:alpha-2-macroglobulin family protein [Planctomycetota bacterium]